jgi:hypothetical protein
MHGRMAERRPDRSFSTISGSVRSWRPIETKSHSPFAIISSPTSGRTRPTAMTGTDTAAFTAAA